MTNKAGCPKNLYKNWLHFKIKYIQQNLYILCQYPQLILKSVIFDIRQFNRCKVISNFPTINKENLQSKCVYFKLKLSLDPYTIATFLGILYNKKRLNDQRNKRKGKGLANNIIGLSTSFSWTSMILLLLSVVLAWLGCTSWSPRGRQRWPDYFQALAGDFSDHCAGREILHVPFCRLIDKYAPSSLSCVINFFLQSLAK